MYHAYHAQNPGGGVGGRVLAYMGVMFGLNRFVPLKMVFASPTLEQSKKKSIS